MCFNFSDSTFHIIFQLRKQFWWYYEPYCLGIIRSSCYLSAFGWREAILFSVFSHVLHIFLLNLLGERLHNTIKWNGLMNVELLLHFASDYLKLPCSDSASDKYDLNITKMININRLFPYFIPSLWCYYTLNKKFYEWTNSLRITW